jgi:hypothetical protein
MRFLKPAAIALAFGVVVAAPALARKGGSTLITKSLVAVSTSGARDPAKDTACVLKFGQHLHKVVQTIYHFSPDKQTAVVYFGQASYKLHTMGIAGGYSFSRYYNPPILPLKASAVLVTVTKDETKVVNSFVLPLDPKTNCLLSTQPSS